MWVQEAASKKPQDRNIRDNTSLIIIVPYFIKNLWKIKNFVEVNELFLMMNQKIDDSVSQLRVSP